MARGSNMSSERTPGSSSRASLLFSLEDQEVRDSGACASQGATSAGARFTIAGVCLQKLGPSSAGEVAEYDPVLEVAQLRQAGVHTDAEKQVSGPKDVMAAGCRVHSPSWCGASQLAAAAGAQAQANCCTIAATFTLLRCVCCS